MGAGNAPSSASPRSKIDERSLSLTSARRRRRRNIARRKRYVVSTAGGSGTVTAMGTSAASITSTARSLCPGPTSTTRYSAGSARSAASQRILRPARSDSPGDTASCAAGRSDSPGTLVGTSALAMVPGPPSSTSGSLRPAFRPKCACRFDPAASASTSTTGLPSCAKYTARFTATRLLPTPPRPPPTAMKRPTLFTPVSR